MPQDECSSSSFASPCKSLRGGFKALHLAEGVHAELDINDELALRKAEEAATRRFQAVGWLRQMDQGASETLSNEPSEEEFCRALRNGLILCNILNKVNPGSVSKVVENPVIDVQVTDGAAQSAIQYFENMRNFLVAVGDMKLLTFEASDLEKGGSSSKVVDCILCLKGYHEWKQAGGIGVWKYGGIVRITSSNKGPTAFLGGDSCEGVDDSLDTSALLDEQRLLEIVRYSNVVSHEASTASDALNLIFDKFGLRFLLACLSELNEVEDVPLNMIIDIALQKVIKEFDDILISRCKQLGLFLKDMLKIESGNISKEEFIEAISRYLCQRPAEASAGCPTNLKVCICGARLGEERLCNYQKIGGIERLHLQEEQIEELKSALHETRLQVQFNQSKWKAEMRKLAHHIAGLETAATSYHKVLEENRVLYNQVQDLRGSIRVYCRVRPFLPGQSSSQSTVDYIGENGSIMIVNPHKQGKDSRKIFRFNKVFGANVTQEQVFVDTQPLIRSVLDGYNVCIFAYGQTGSGKTYTMSGPDLATVETWGVNYRALNDLFEISKGRKDAISYEVTIQMIEIYNEQVRDLLVSDGSNRRLDIRNNSQLNGLNVPDASLVPVQCTRDVLDLMRIGHKNRAVGATALNVRSSRSHSVFTVHVYGKELVSGSILRGCLHLVDLAGSERVDKSEAVGDRLKEAQHINRSLSALGDVIAALAQKSAHIPYRNSKLTQVLQDSLGGQAKTLMFVHINPETNAIGETISTLKFAERVTTIELGAAHANKETGEVRELKEEVSSLKASLERKEAELEHLKNGHLYRIGQEMQRTRNVSPSPVQRCGFANLRARPIDEPKRLEDRSCSSGRQIKSRLPLGISDKEINPRFPMLADEKFMNSRKPRSPSPPVRRSISTDRGALLRSSKLKLDNQEELLSATKLPILPKVRINKSVASIPVLSANENSKGFLGPQEISKQDNISDVLSRLHRAHSRKVYPEQEEEQFKQALTVRQGGIRKSKTEAKTKTKYQVPGRIQKSDGVAWPPNVDAGGKMDVTQKSNSPELENETAEMGSPVLSSSLKLKMLPQNFGKNSQNIEPRYATLSNGHLS